MVPRLWATDTDIHTISMHGNTNTTTFRYVHSHYRPPLDTVGCVASLLYWHNETVNVLTHFIPVIIITGRG